MNNIRNNWLHTDNWGEQKMQTRTDKCRIPSHMPIAMAPPPHFLAQILAERKIWLDHCRCSLVLESGNLEMWLLIKGYMRSIRSVNTKKDGKNKRKSTRKVRQKHGGKSMRNGQEQTIYQTWHCWRERRRKTTRVVSTSVQSSKTYSSLSHNRVEQRLYIVGPQTYRIFIYFRFSIFIKGAPG